MNKIDKEKRWNKLIITAFLLALFLLQVSILIKINSPKSCNSYANELSWRGSLVSEQSNRWDIYYSQIYGQSMSKDDTLFWLAKIKSESTDFINRDLNYLNTYKNYMICLQSRDQEAYNSLYDSYEQNINISYNDMNEIKDSYNVWASDYNQSNISIPKY